MPDSKIRERSLALASAAAFVATVLAANWAVGHFGLISVGFGLMATAGTYFAGLSFVLRDSVQDYGGRRLVLAAILVGAALSYLVASPFIATASGVAFLCSESADFAVYTPLRARGYIRAAIASNVVGAIVDTFLFLWIAGFGIAAPLVEGQFVGKLTVTALTIVIVLLVRGVHRRRAVPA